jgi:hypothetical protein
VAGEIAIVAIGILIAFSLDSWWDRLQLNRQEHRYLASLEQDFLETRREVEQTLLFQHSVLESARRLVQYGATTAAIPEADSVVHHIDVILRYTPIEIDPVLRTYDELLNTASLQVIRADTSHTLLAAFNSNLQMVRRTENGAANNWDRAITEYLYRQLDLAAGMSRLLLDDDSDLEMLPSEVDYSRLPRDRIFRNIMTTRMLYTLVKIGMYEELMEYVDEILETIAAELNR